jgi:hypothetical protein
LLKRWARRSKNQPATIATSKIDIIIAKNLIDIHVQNTVILIAIIAHWIFIKNQFGHSGSPKKCKEISLKTHIDQP